jgi:hypothetical protein
MALGCELFPLLFLLARHDLTEVFIVVAIRQGRNVMLVHKQIKKNTSGCSLLLLSLVCRCNHHFVDPSARISSALCENGIRTEKKNIYGGEIKRDKMIRAMDEVCVQRQPPIGTMYDLRGGMPNLLSAGVLHRSLSARCAKKIICTCRMLVTFLVGL